MTKTLILEILDIFFSLMAMISLIFLFFILPGCQFVQKHPEIVEELETGAEKILEFEIQTLAKNSSINAALEANYEY